MRGSILLFIAVAMLASCERSEGQVVMPTTEKSAERLFIGIDDEGEAAACTLSDEGEAATRVQLNEAIKTVWTQGDIISVYNRTNANNRWKFAGQTGERMGEFIALSNDVGKRELPKIVAIYPYNAEYWISTTSCNVDTKLSEEQIYAENSYGLGSSIMVAAGEEGELFMRNVCGWLRLHISGNGERVRRVLLRGNDEEQVAGRIFIDTSNGDSTLVSESSGGGSGEVGGVLIFDGDIITEVSLLCTECELTPEGRTLYIALPPQSFAKGITATIECEDGSSMQRIIEREVVIKRNHILPVKPFAYAPNTKL